ncbi:MAG: TetR/AcrR family transcriptional regulator [Fulvivirga sp.]|uniref:TetR/AcrR family transcriptional regulator n=1 Tax=Fulvivirga sp. TaxID=1931237 RepID=UPI0032F87E3B
MAVLQLLMSEQLFLRDPQETDLGKKMIQESIIMIDELGFEKFTFKKLAERIESTEASIYRYFDNKHRLLVYLIAWYWNWLEFRIDYATNNIESAVTKLEIALKIVTELKTRDASFPQIDEEALFRIVILESDKTYLTKQVDDDNREGLFRGFKSLCTKIAGFVQEINPDYKAANSLISTVLHSAHHQLFYAEHLPSLTNLSYGKNMHSQNEEFLKDLIFKTIKA